MTNVSRRSIAKGAAWSVPAVVVGAPAAMAAASFANVTCYPLDKNNKPFANVSLNDSGVKSYSGTIGTDSTYDPAHVGPLNLTKRGTYVSLSAGMWAFAAPVDSNGNPLGYVTGYKLRMANPTQVGVLSGDGTKSYGTYTGGMIETPQVRTAGLATAFNIQTKVPYAGSGMVSANDIVGISVPFCITWLAGLTPTDIGTTLNECCYYVNYTFNKPVLNSAGVADNGNAYSVTILPQYGPAAV